MAFGRLPPAVEIRQRRLATNSAFLDDIKFAEQREW
jgi:hypothetical protein